MSKADELKPDRCARDRVAPERERRQGKGVRDAMNSADIV